MSQQEGNKDDDFDKNDPEVTKLLGYPQDKGDTATTPKMAGTDRTNTVNKK